MSEGDDDRDEPRCYCCRRPQSKGPCDCAPPQQYVFYNETGRWCSTHDKYVENEP